MNRRRHLWTVRRRRLELARLVRRARLELDLERTHAALNAWEVEWLL